MPRKVKIVKISPIVPVVEEIKEIKEIKTEVVTPPEINETTEPGTEIKNRRPRKKQRRPTLSDTIPAIPVAAFQRLVREIGDERRSDMRWEAEALEALQVDVEAYLIEKFQKARNTLDLFGKSGKTVGGNMLRV